ncbi:MAG TPA: acyl-CoA thioesterase/bile acid-CoA:amino acid N-acyltransferase family protein [Ktedonobacteraceae bacterium]|nr:acyl-CoA thioesterase/bile acid-CoA:amino acid N-acyltransferase family protein [Ktedonobacteraceae bacterium]
MKTVSADGEPRIDVTPQPCLFDDTLSIRLSGCMPGQAVTLCASLEDEWGRVWTSAAVFVVDWQGCVDLASASPISGSYKRADPMGLCWSATTTRSRRGTFLKRDSEPLTVEITAEENGALIASTTVQRHIIAPDVERVVVRERGLVGTFFRPVRVSARPALLVFGGAEGGLHEGRAALLASWGYPALALAYFDMEHLPAELASIPLEYFETALTWLSEQEGVDHQTLIVMGTSRGGEAALLLGATFSQVRAVIAVVPSSFAWESESASGYRPAWTYAGQGVPCLRWPSGSPTEDVSENEIRAYLSGHPKLVEQATIPVERICGPLLLISGTGDHIWPTTYFCERIVARLDQAHHAFSYQHIAYRDAGHLFTLPHLPTTLVWHGGSAEAMARANADSWQQVRAFLSTICSGAK